MKRFQRAVAVFATAVIAGAGLTALTATSASAADIGSLTFTPTSGGDFLAPVVTTSGPCPAGTQSLNVQLTGGNVPAVGNNGDPVYGIGNNAADVAKNPISASFELTLVDIANNNNPVFSFRPPAGQPPLVYTATLYCSSDIFGVVLTDTYDGQFTVASDGTYREVVAAVATTIKPLTASPASPATTADTVSFTADVDAANGTAPVGSVQFTRGGANIGTALPVNASGVAIFSGTLPAGSGSIVATFTGTSPYGNATSAALPYTVNGVVVPAKPTSITLAVNPISGPSFQQVTLTGTVAVASGTPAGTCSFKNGTAVIGTSPVASGVCSFQTTGLSGNVSLTVAFVPTDAALFTGSTSAAVTASYAPPTTVPDQQTIIVTVPVGNLTIFTPYTPSAPLNLGPMVLNDAGTAFNATAVFNKVTITDTRPGDPGWTASLTGADFVGPTSTDIIPVGKSSFTRVTPTYISGNAIQAGDVTATNLPALTTSPQAFATATAGNGTGTVEVVADFNLSGVSTSTKPGQYTATVVFTIA